MAHEERRINRAKAKANNRSDVADNRAQNVAVCLRCMLPGVCRQGFLES